MEAETKMSQEEAVAILASVRGMLKLHNSIFDEIVNLITASANMGLDTVDSRLLLQILSRYGSEYKKLTGG